MSDDLGVNQYVFTLDPAPPADLYLKVFMAHHTESARINSYPETLWAWLNKPSAEAELYSQASGLGPSIRLHRHPSELKACVGERLNHMPDDLEDSAIGELVETHRQWDADETSFNSIRKLSEPGTVIVVTGQQPGLAAGPLLVLYKTMAAIRLARELDEQLDSVQVVPVFWVASEDHDFDEIRTACWPGQDGRPIRYVMDDQACPPGMMMGGIRTDETGLLMAQLIRETTPSTGFRETVLDWIEDHYCSGSNLETAFCSTLLRLFRGSGLVIVSPLMDWIRRRASHVVSHELDSPGFSTSEILRKTELIRSAGFKPVLHRRETALNLFMVEEQGTRKALHIKDEDTCVIRDVGGDKKHEREIGLADLKSMQDQPGRFSMNVVTRTVLQDLVLPTVAQVVGPGEAAYLVQVESVYGQFGSFRPVRWPRPEVLLIESRIKRFLEKMHLSVEFLPEYREADYWAAWFDRHGRDKDQEKVESVKKEQLEALQEFRSIFSDSDPSIRRSIDRLEEQMERGYSILSERISQVRQDRDEQLNRGLALLNESLYPNGSTQERHHNPLVPYAVNYGMDWAGVLLNNLEYHPGAGVQQIDLGSLFNPARVEEGDGLIIDEAFRKT
jgi:bacillithiol biosynthesis cysteine-adding enzyme BshC